jgi:hypothetical protein
MLLVTRGCCFVILWHWFQTKTLLSWLCNVCIVWSKSTLSHSLARCLHQLDMISLHYAEPNNSTSFNIQLRNKEKTSTKTVLPKQQLRTIWSFRFFHNLICLMLDSRHLGCPWKPRIGSTLNPWSDRNTMESAKQSQLRSPDIFILALDYCRNGTADFNRFQ